MNNEPIVAVLGLFVAALVIGKLLRATMPGFRRRPHMGRREVAGRGCGGFVLVGVFIAVLFGLSQYSFHESAADAWQSAPQTMIVGGLVGGGLGCWLLFGVLKIDKWMDD